MITQYQKKTIKELNSMISFEIDYDTVAMGDTKLLEKIDMFFTYLSLTNYNLTSEEKDRWNGVCAIISQLQEEGEVSYFDYFYNYEGEHKQVIEIQIKEMKDILESQLFNFKKANGLDVKFFYDNDTRSGRFIVPFEQVVSFKPKIKKMIDSGKVNALFYGRS